MATSIPLREHQSSNTAHGAPAAIAAAVAAHQASPLSHAGRLLRPTGAIAESIPRWAAGASLSIVSGRQTLALLWLEAGQPVTTILLCSGATAAVSPTNQWFTLYSSALAKLAVTADDLTAGWAANTAKGLTVASGPYIVPTSGFYYVGVVVVAGTTPTIACSQSTAGLVGRALIGTGADLTNTGLTTPSTAPATAAALTTHSSMLYVEIR